MPPPPPNKNQTVGFTCAFWRWRAVRTAGELGAPAAQQHTRGHIPNNTHATCLPACLPGGVQEVPLVIVSHDREFLDQLCTKIVETERGVSTTYAGNYTQYVNSKVRAPRHAASTPNSLLAFSHVQQCLCSVQGAPHTLAASLPPAHLPACPPPSLCARCPAERARRAAVGGV